MAEEERESRWEEEKTKKEMRREERGGEMVTSEVREKKRERGAK